jgi:hypothetical protein
LKSGTYPFRHDRVVQPTSIELPAVDCVQRAFERFVFPVEHTVAESEIVGLAQTNSTEGVTICVPYFGNGQEDILLKPAVACPRCGNASIVGRFGHRRVDAQRIRSIDEAIERSRKLDEDLTVELRLDHADARLSCWRVTTEAGTTINWHVARIGTAEIAPIVDELVAKLTVRGSTCDELARYRAFTRLRERVAP